MSHSQPCPVPCTAAPPCRERRHARPQGALAAPGMALPASAAGSHALCPAQENPAARSSLPPCRTRCTAPRLVTSRLTWRPSQPRWREGARSRWSCGMRGRGSCWTRCCPQRWAATGHARLLAVPFQACRLRTTWRCPHKAGSAWHLPQLDAWLRECQGCGRGSR